MLHTPRLACIWISILILLFPIAASSEAYTPIQTSAPEIAYTQISSGGYHTCALTSAGEVWCWGMNDDGRVGDGTNTNRSIPVAVVGLAPGVLQVVAARSHSCALTASGGVKCWGANYVGQLGDGTTADHSTPVDVSGLSSGVKSLAADGLHTCALLTSGGLKCWGYNHNGQLGDGTNDNRLAPVSVSELSDSVNTVAAGDGHTCAVLAGGGIKCWGKNQNGQLGDGTTQERWTPTDVAGLGGAAVVVSGGGYHTCALMSSGGVKCWGWNWVGQLGTGTNQDSYLPVDVVGLAGGAKRLDVGFEFTCVWAVDGWVKCWGLNSNGMLGTGDTNTSYTPLNVTGLLGNFSDLSTGWEHSCVLTASGQARCWGFNGLGQLGNGAIIQRSVPVEIMTLASGVQQVSSGYMHTCAVTAEGGVKCWGRNWFGQVGDGTNENARSLPVDVVGLASGISNVSLGAEHTCALTSLGGVKCWGSNSAGQLGDGTRVSRTTPVDVVGLASGISAVSAGGVHTCALTSSGGVKCWGANEAGQLGDGTKELRTTPVDVVGLSSGVLAISQSCALLAGGGVKCWGFDGNTTPVDIAGLESGVSAVSVGGYHACAITVSGVKCWGSNEHGQLGCGAVGCSFGGGLTDVVGLPGDVIAVEAGLQHTCAILTGGGLMCWGRNFDGELGDGTTEDRYAPVGVHGLASATTGMALSDTTCAIAAGRLKCWGAEIYGQLGQASDSFEPAPVAVVAGAGEHLRQSETYGQPGSLFTITGWNLPASSAITLTLNGAALSPSLEVNPTGSFTCFLDTTGAGAGYFVLRVQSAPQAAISIVLDAGYPLRPQEGGGATLSTPPGLGVPAYLLYLPAVQMK